MKAGSSEFGDQLDRRAVLARRYERVGGLPPRLLAPFAPPASQQKVILALYLASDESGLNCTASNAEIGRRAGLAAGTVKQYLAGFERDGEIAVFMPGAYVVPVRVIILADHPDAARAMRRLCRMRPRRGRRLGV
jgi:hypothetical protein